MGNYEITQNNYRFSIMIPSIALLVEHNNIAHTCSSLDYNILTKTRKTYKLIKIVLSIYQIVIWYHITAVVTQIVKHIVRFLFFR